MTPSAVPTHESNDESTQALPSPAAAAVKPPSPGTAAPLDASKLVVTKTSCPQDVPDPSTVAASSCSVCTDHMITAVWNARTGWGAPELKPYGPLSLMPTASCLHYATECFEGMKVYRGIDSKLRLFRPDCNAERFLTSAARVALPAFEPREVVALVRALVAHDGPKWLPAPNSFLYLRPTLIGSAAQLGVTVPPEATLFIIAAFMPAMDAPPCGMKLVASAHDTVRAWPGGFGHAKVGANYGPSLRALADAHARGFDQVLWLLGEEAAVTEAGASNFFVVWREKGSGQLQLVTAPLDDKIILDGVTRRSVIALVRERLGKQGATPLEALEVVERKYTMFEVAEAVEEGRMVEAFACGTAFFVVAVSLIHFRGKDLAIPLARGNTGEYASLIKSWLKNIMYGKEAHEWGVVVDEVPS